jgi:hypothetical protein
MWDGEEEHDKLDNVSESTDLGTTSGKMCFDKGEETGTCDLTSAHFKV